MSIEQTKERLENWKAWARDKIHYRITPSLEGRYRPPPSWHPPEPKQVVDIFDAAKVEATLTNPTFPEKYRKIIVYAYITPYININVFCRKNGVRARGMDEDLKTAIMMLENRLK